MKSLALLLALALAACAPARADTQSNWLDFTYDSPSYPTSGKSRLYFDGTGYPTYANKDRQIYGWRIPMLPLNLQHIAPLPQYATQEEIRAKVNEIVAQLQRTDPPINP